MKPFRKLNRAAYSAFGGLVSEREIWDFEWDVCCVLDGCRVDTLSKFREGVDSYWSVGSASGEWTENTFDSVDTSDVALITGNPFSDMLTPDYFAYFHQEPVRVCDGVETISPERLTDIACKVWRDREELGVEKIVVHYMQPHAPFRSRPSWFSDSGSKFGSYAWWMVRDGEVSRREFMDAYEDNLQWVLSEGVERLSERIEADVMVTADHGNACGEWGVYAHPAGVAVPAVRKVPKLMFEGSGDRSVEGDIIGDVDYDTAEQLEALGYSPGGVKGTEDCC